MERKRLPGATSLDPAAPARAAVMLNFLLSIGD